MFLEHSENAELINEASIATAPTHNAALRCGILCNVWGPFNYIIMLMVPL